MPTVTAIFDRIRLIRRTPIPTEAQAALADLRLGLGGVLLVTMMLIASATFYFLPLGKTSYTAELIEAGAVQAGDDIRMAGVPVGKVTGVELQDDDRVRVRFTVDDDVFVGDQSTLDVKMLTIVGGHYVALTSAGTAPLGATPIPADRVRLPYSLAQAFQDAAAPIAEVDGDTLRGNLAALHASLSTSPDSLRSAGAAIDSLVDILVTQNDQVSRALTVADEYLTAINASKSLIGKLIAKLVLLQNVVIDKQAEIGEALRVTNEALARLAALGPAWDTTLEPMARKLADALPELQRLGARMGDAATGVHTLLTRLRNLISPAGTMTIDQSSTTVELSELCVPVAGRGC